MRTKAHYDTHLSLFYEWMLGDYNKNVKAFEQFLVEKNLSKGENKKALDLGAGNGAQSIALARHHYEVIAVDFCERLIYDLDGKKKGLPVTTIVYDISGFISKTSEKFDLIVCWGDTLTHLPNMESIIDVIEKCSQLLMPQGKIVFSFRDYTNELLGSDRFIPVKSDANRILTCFLEYLPEQVRVTDIIHQKIGGKWEQRTSYYYKTRLEKGTFTELLVTNGFKLQHSESGNGMLTFVAQLLD